MSIDLPVAQSISWFPECGQNGDSSVASVLGVAERPHSGLHPHQNAFTMEHAERPAPILVAALGTIATASLPAGCPTAAALECSRRVQERLTRRARIPSRILASKRYWGIQRWRCTGRDSSGSGSTVQGAEPWMKQAQMSWPARSARPLRTCLPN